MKIRTHESHRLAPTASFPNSPLPVIVYRGVLAHDGEELARAFERLFSAHRWPSAWRNGLYATHHFHSTAHEVLGVYAGWVEARLGGETGVRLRLEAGDALLIPAGVAHRNEGQSPDFRVVGAYPTGTEYDMCYGKPEERAAAEGRIAAVPIPALDPVAGEHGPLLQLWKT